MHAIRALWKFSPSGGRMQLRNKLHIPPWFYVRLGPNQKFSSNTIFAELVSVVYVLHMKCECMFKCLFSWSDLVKLGIGCHTNKMRHHDWACEQLHSASLISGCRCTWWLFLVTQEEVVTGRGWHICSLHPFHSNVFNTTYATGESLRHGTTPNPSGLGTGSHIHPANRPLYQCALEFLQHARGLAQDKALQCR